MQNWKCPEKFWKPKTRTPHSSCIVYWCCTLSVGAQHLATDFLYLKKRNVCSFASMCIFPARLTFIIVFVVVVGHKFVAHCYPCWSHRLYNDGCAFKMTNSVCCVVDSYVLLNVRFVCRWDVKGLMFFFSRRKHASLIGFNFGYKWISFIFQAKLDFPSRRKKEQFMI